MRPIKNRIIFLEGIDKSGKTAIRDRMYKEKHLYQYWIEDRGFVSRHVYHAFRQDPPESLANWQIPINVLVKNNLAAIVYLNVNPEIAVKRHLSKNEYPEFTKDEFKDQQNIYTEVLGYYNLYFNVPVLEIDTAIYNIDESINLIKDWINTKEAELDLYTKAIK